MNDVEWMLSLASSVSALGFAVALMFLLAKIRSWLSPSSMIDGPQLGLVNLADRSPKDWDPTQIKDYETAKTIAKQFKGELLNTLPSTIRISMAGRSKPLNWKPDSDKSGLYITHGKSLSGFEVNGFQAMITRNVSLEEREAIAAAFQSGATSDLISIEKKSNSIIFADGVVLAPGDFVVLEMPSEMTEEYKQIGVTASNAELLDSYVKGRQYVGPTETEGDLTQFAVRYFHKDRGQPEIGEPHQFNSLVGVVLDVLDEDFLCNHGFDIKSHVSNLQAA